MSVSKKKPRPNARPFIHHDRHRLHSKPKRAAITVQHALWISFVAGHDPLLSSFFSKTCPLCVNFLLCFFLSTFIPCSRRTTINAFRLSFASTRRARSTSCARSRACRVSQRAGSRLHRAAGRLGLSRPRPQGVVRVVPRLQRVLRRVHGRRTDRCVRACCVLQAQGAPSSSCWLHCCRGSRTCYTTHACVWGVMRWCRPGPVRGGGGASGRAVCVCFGARGACAPAKEGVTVPRIGSGDL